MTFSTASIFHDVLVLSFCVRLGSRRCVILTRWPLCESGRQSTKWIRLDVLASVATVMTAALSFILSLPFLSVSSSRVFFSSLQCMGGSVLMCKISLEGVSCHDLFWVAPFF